MCTSCGRKLERGERYISVERDCICRECAEKLELWQVMELLEVGRVMELFEERGTVQTCRRRELGERRKIHGTKIGERLVF